MAITKAYAKILAGMLDGEQLDTFEVICGKRDQVNDIPTTVLDELKALELIRLDTDLISGKSLAILTARGKKVAEFVGAKEDRNG